MSIFADCFKWQCQINFLELLIQFLNPFFLFILLCIVALQCHNLLYLQQDWSTEVHEDLEKYLYASHYYFLRGLRLYCLCYYLRKYLEVTQWQNSWFVFVSCNNRNILHGRVFCSLLKTNMLFILFYSALVTRCDFFV